MKNNDEYLLPKNLIPDKCNQYSTNMCMAFASCGVLQILNLKKTGERRRFSPTYMFARYRQGGGKSRGIFEGELKDGLLNLGACFYEDCPDYSIAESAAALAYVENHKEELDDKAKAYRARILKIVAKNRAELFGAIKAAIKERQEPILGAIDTGETNHAVCFVGYDGDKIAYRTSDGYEVIRYTNYEDIKWGYTMELLSEEKTENIGFEDVSENDWFFDAVKYCANSGLMTGTGEGKFEPNRALTRAELAQVLFNMKSQGGGKAAS